MRIVERQIAYSPLPSQRKFHQSAARFRGFSGPIASGKSQALCHEAIRMAYKNPGRQGFLGAPTYRMLKDATLTSLLQILEANRIPYRHHKADNILEFSDCRSQVILRSLDEYEHLRGTNLAWFGVDELSYCKAEAWNRLEGRLRDPHATVLGGFAVWTPKGYDWVYERFIKNPPEGYETIKARPFENRHLLAAVPDFYERLKRSYDEQFYQQEVLGDYLNIGASRVYYAFDREVHVAPTRFWDHVPLLWALDFNVEPMCSIVAQKLDHTFWIHDEIVISRGSTLDACHEFHRRFQGRGLPLVIYGDASGQRLQTSGTTDYQIIRDFFHQQGIPQVQYRVPRSNPTVRDRILTVNAQLRNAAGEINLVINPCCRELIADLEQVSYQKDTLTIDKEKDPRRTHLSDALGYLLWQERQPETYIGERNVRLF